MEYINFYWSLRRGKNMIKNISINPFYLYSISWFITLVAYKCNIIKIFPKLNLELEFFIYFSIFISVILGKKLRIKEILLKETKEETIVFIVILIGWILTFLYEKKIPLIEILTKSEYKYSDFVGIPIISGFIYTLTTYHSIKSFIQYMTFKKMKYLFYIFCEMLFYILIYRRGPILILFIANFLVYIHIKKIKWLLVKGSIIGLVIMYMFGILGNIRHGFQMFDTRLLKDIIQVKTKYEFLDPFLWSYTYITSPLSNLQYTIESGNIQINIIEYLKNNFLPDFIQKRLIIKTEIKLLLEALTVQTGYNLSLINLGIIGMYTTFISYTAFQYFYIKLLKNTDYILITLILLSIANIFFTFTNMYVNSTIGITILYPLAFYIIRKIIKIFKK